MLEDPNYPIPNSDPFERDILSELQGSEPNRFPASSEKVDRQTSDLSYPPANSVNSPNDVLLLPDSSVNLTDSNLSENTKTDILTGSSLRRSSIVLPEENFLNCGIFHSRRNRRNRHRFYLRRRLV
jgi:hypothetical protein